MASPDGHWLAQSGFTAKTIGIPESGREVSAINSFSRIRNQTGQGGPVVRVPVTYPDDPYAGWNPVAFGGKVALLAETSGDGCGGRLYGYQLADLAAGSLLNTPKPLRQGYATFTGCGCEAPLPEANFAPDNRLLLRVGNRLDWWVVGEK